MKYLLFFIFIFASNSGYAITVDDVLKQHGKNKVVSVLSQQFQNMENNKLTIEFNGVFKKMHRPAKTYITSQTISKDLGRLGLTINQFHDIIIRDIQQKNTIRLQQTPEVTDTNRRVVKCIENGNVYYQSEECDVEVSSEQLSGFKFDGWQSGMSLYTIKQIARNKQLPMSPGNSIYISRYNEKHLNSKPAETNYTYRTELMGKMTTVILSFTKNTKKLFQTKATFHISQLKPEERKYFYESLYSQLSEKYGKAKNISRDDVNKSVSASLFGFFFRDLHESLLGSLMVWGLNTEDVVTLNYKKNYHTMPSYELVYKNMPLSNVNKIEITDEIKQRTNKVLSKDEGRL